MMYDIERHSFAAAADAYNRSAEERASLYLVCSTEPRRHGPNRRRTAGRRSGLRHTDVNWHERLDGSQQRCDFQVRPAHRLRRTEKPHIVSALLHAIWKALNIHTRCSEFSSAVQRQRQRQRDRVCVYLHSFIVFFTFMCFIGLADRIEGLRERTEHFDIFFCPSLSGVLFPMFCLQLEGKCQIFKILLIKY